jgi:hypothetical protein
LICASSPYGRSGELYSAYEQHYGPSGDPRILVAKAASIEANPTLPQAFIEREMAKDPVRNAAEYGGQFRQDLEAFISRDALEACVAKGVVSRAYDASRSYTAFIDNASGSGADRTAMSIVHMDGNRPVADRLLVFRPPFRPHVVTGEICRALRAFGISECVGDRYAGGWPIEAFSQYGVRYVPCEMSKSQLYAAFLPLVNSGRVALLDVPEVITEFCGLERRVSRMGAAQDIIDHRQGRHDDQANVIAGACVIAAGDKFNWNWGVYFETWQGPTLGAADDNRPWEGPKGEAAVAAPSSSEVVNEGVERMWQSYATGVAITSSRRAEACAGEPCIYPGAPLTGSVNTDGDRRWHVGCGAPTGMPRERDRQAMATRTRQWTI